MVIRSVPVLVGELPYRDFTWQYPPLSIFVLGGAFRLFGATFATAQVVIDLLSSLLVFCVWQFARRLLSRGPAFAIVLLFAAVGGAQCAYAFPLFSLTIYTPAILTGSIGVLLACTALVDLVRMGRLRVGGWIQLALGSLLALLSKPECAIVIAAAAIAIALGGGLCGRFSPACGCGRLRS